MKRFFSLLLLISIFFGCKDKTVTPDTPVTKIDFSLSKTEAFPLQLLKLSLTDASALKIIKGKIGTVDFEANQIDTKTYAFLVPVALKEGTYDLTVTDGKTPRSIKVKPAKEIASPVDYTQTYLNATRSILNDRLKTIQDSLVKKNLTTQQAVSQERDLITANLKAATDKFSLLSEENKKKCVAFIDANRILFDEANQALADVNFQITKNPAGRITVLCAEGTALEKVKCQITNFTTALAKINEAVLSLSAPAELEADPSIAAGMAVLSDAVGLQGMIEAKNVGDKLVKLSYILAEPALQILNNGSTATDFAFKAGVEKSMNLTISVRNIQEDLDSSSTNVLNKSFAKNLRKFISVWDQNIGVALADKPAFASLTKTLISPEIQSDILVEVIGNTSVTPVFSFKNGGFNLSFANSGTSDQTFDFKVTYKYDGAEASVTKKGTVSKPVVLKDTTWDVTIIYSSALSWHANVTFFADGTTKYDEPDSPGVFTSYGAWTLTGDKIHWYLDKAREANWSFDGTVTDNTITGTFSPAARVWTAKKM